MLCSTFVFLNSKPFDFIHRRMPTPTRPLSKRKYKQEDVEKAVDVVRREGMSIAAAAKSFGIPKSTLQDKVNGKYSLDARIGRPSVLTPEEEKLIVNWIVDIAKAGFPVTKDALVSSVSRLVKDLGRDNPFTESVPGEKWYKLFLNRHQNISERVSQALTTSRANVTENQLRGWFSEVKDFLREKNLLGILEDPRRIYNADETAFFLCPKGSKVLARKGERNVHTVTGNDEKECLTVLVNASASGEVAPPMIVFPYERIPATIANSIPDIWGIGKSESGWMTSESFYEYVTNVFHPWLLTNKVPMPILFFIDGHSSHVTKHLSEFCEKNLIELVALYPNATHLLQPMDVAVFHPIKAAWKKKCWKMEAGTWRQENEKGGVCPIVGRSVRQYFETSINHKWL